VAPTDPTPSGFVRHLEAELRLRGAAFELAALLGYVEAVWALAREDPDPVRWADAFLRDAGAAADVTRTEEAR
jgi:hypothetical protein